MKLYCFLLLLMCLGFGARAQKFTLSGEVADSASGESLINATIIVDNNLQACITNAYGFYSIALSEGSHSIAVSYVGYTLKTLVVNIKANSTNNILLVKSATIGEVEVNAFKRNVIRSSRMSLFDVKIEQTLKTPTLMGEPDMFKVLQMSAGVEAGTEGSSGLYVRGGDNGQNLTLIDGVPVYNVSHMMGFISVFNPEAVRKTEMIKGGIPARYGGRVSSVVDVRMKEGNNQKLKGAINISTLLAGVSVEGPIGEKTGFMLAARRTLLDPVYARFNEADGVSDQLYTCWDVNAKINHRLNENNRVYASFFMGYDYSRSKEEDRSFTFERPQLLQNTSTVLMDTIKRSMSANEQHKWGNMLGAVRWNHTWNSKLFSNTSITYTKYYNNHTEEQGYIETNLNTGVVDDKSYVFSGSSDIEDVAGAIDFDWYAAAKHHVRFGVQSIAHQYNPNFSLLSYINNVNTKAPQLIPANESAFYFEDDVSLFDNLTLNMGLRNVVFSMENKLQHSIEPRLSLVFVGNENWSIKSSYTRSSQFVHLVSSSSMGFSTDYWVPASTILPAEKSNQWALGTVIALPSNLLLTTEAYFKTMDHVIEFRDDRVFTVENSDYESYMCSGKGWSYGIESMLQKTEGKFTGWISYTWARSFRQFDLLNLGESFPYKYDRPHNLTVVSMYSFNERWDIGINWMLASGYNFSFGKEKFFNYYYYGKNNMRYPAYHRLDIGSNWHKQKKHGKRTWRAGAYNAYNQMNASYYNVAIDYSGSMSPEFGTNDDVLGINITKITLFPFIPYVSYRFAFGN